MDFKSEIFRIINNSISYPAFLLDKDGIIISFNEQAKTVFGPEEVPGSFNNLFKNPSSRAILDLFNSCLSNNKNVSEELTLELPEKKPAKYELTFTPVLGVKLNDEEEILIILTINQSDHEGINYEKIKLGISTSDLHEILTDENAIRVFDEIKSSFPFTFLGKNRIQNEINKLEEAFWLKDNEGKFILVNQKFARLLGLKPQQIIGKPEKDFLPGHLKQFYSSINQFIETTSNSIIKEGLPFPQSSELEDLQVCEFPLSDLDNNVIAIIGLVNKRRSAPDVSLNNGLLLFIDALSNSGLPVILLDLSGEISFQSIIIQEIFNLSSSGIGINFDNYLPADFSRDIVEFITNEDAKEKRIEKQFHYKKENLIFEFVIRKVYNPMGDLKGYILIGNEKKQNDDKVNKTNGREKMYDILMQTSPEPMFIYDIENLRFLEVNRAALDVYGYNKNEFMQMDLTDLYAPEDIQTLLDSSNQRNKEGLFTGPWRHKKRDGSVLLVEIAKTSFEYNGRKAHFNIIRNVNEQVEMQKENQIYKSAFLNTSDMVFTTDADGFISLTNESVRKKLGYPSNELIDRPFITLLSDESRAEIKNSIFNSKLSKPVSFEVEFKKVSSGLFKAELTATPIIDFSSQVTSYSIVAQDREPSTIATPTMERVAETKEIKTTGTLDPEFLSSMFHEILTPMNVILGFIQELTESIENPSEEQKEAEDIISQNSKLLLQTMDSVLEYSHIEQNRIQVKPEKIFFTELLDSLQSNTKKIADSKQLELTYGKISSSLSLETDRHRLESLLSILISVSIRITKEKKIFLSAFQYDDKYGMVSIKDNRQAISPYLLGNLTEIFSVDEKLIKKDFGASKLTIRLARKLLTLLHGKFEIIERAGQKVEAGFLFPMDFSTVVEEKAASKPAEEKTDQPKDASVAAAAEVAKPTEAQKPIAKQREKLSRQDYIDESDLDLASEPEPAIDIETALRIDEPQKFYESPVNTDQEIYKSEETPVNAEREVITRKQEFVEEPLSVKKSKQSKTSSKIDLSRLKCLYVEDQVDSQILFKVQLKELQKIDFAVSFEAALPLLEQNKYDFIVLDINLQGEYNGLDALRIIRKLPGYDKTHIYAVTAYVLAGDKEKFIAAGFDNFISKPILREKLIEILEKTI